MPTKGSAMSEFRSFDLAQVQKLVSEKRAELLKLQARVRGQDLKNVRAIRTVRQALARLLTRLRELRPSPR